MKLFRNMAGLGAMLFLAGCQVTAQEATIGAGIATTVNNTGAVVSAVVNPATAVPAGIVAGAANGLACGIAKSFGGTC